MATVIGLGAESKNSDKEKIEKANIKLLEENKALKEKIKDSETKLKEANKNGKKSASKDSSGGSGTSETK